ncbi:MAG: CoA transferase [Betaproteobacteria bacterium]|nr:CoA transferase [Betaproteobacteria bacterium]
MSAQALDGLRIAEFGSYAAGPHVGKMLANFGATVIHVESRSRPDGFRLQYPPYRGGKPGIDNGACFAYFNDSKLGVTLDLKNPHGVELAHRLVDGCDVVIENMRPGVIERIGLGYATLRASNPRLVMLSTCNMGQTGPRADTPGFGSQLTALAGMCNLTGDPDGPPMLLYGPYIDFIASTLGAVAVLAALERRDRSGEGAFLDVSQYECGLLFLAGPLLEYHANARIAARAGNADPQAAPHGAYPCAEGGWLALSCWSDAEFDRLAEAIGTPLIARDARFASAAARRRHGAELDAVLTAWLSTRDAQTAAHALQAAQVRAHAVNTVADLFSDPQLDARRQWRRRPHAVIGEQAYCYPGFELSATPGDVTRAAPTLGADNRAVFRDLLGLSDIEYERYRSLGAMD